MRCGRFRTCWEENEMSERFAMIVTQWINAAVIAYTVPYVIGGEWTNGRVVALFIVIGLSAGGIVTIGKRIRG